MRIQGQVVLITGASDGIGAACIEAFRRRGARLSLAARSEEKLARVGGPGALITAGDLTNPDVRRRAVERTIERFGTLDILVNNAGVGLYAPTASAPLDEVRRMFELNLFAAVGMIQLALPHMFRQRSGLVVNVSSIAGRVPLPWFTLYCASKYALSALGDGLRRELRRDGVRVMTVCPGYVRTGFQEHALEGRPPDRLHRARAFVISAEKCAEAIARGVERDARTVVTPWAGWLLILAERLFPSFLDAQMARYYYGLGRAG